LLKMGVVGVRGGELRGGASLCGGLADRLPPAFARVIGCLKPQKVPLGERKREGAREA